jgi:hypothetical protein
LKRKTRKSSKLSQQLENLQYYDNNNDLNEYNNLGGNENDNDSNYNNHLYINNDTNDDYDGLNFNFKQSDSTSNGEGEESQLGVSGSFKVFKNLYF